MKNFSWKILLIMTLSVLVRTEAAFAELHVVATVPDIGSVAQIVGGDAVEVKVLCPGDTDPHFLPAKPSLARTMGHADLLIYNGLEIEVGWLPQLIKKARNPDIKPGKPGDIDCSQAIDTLLEVPTGPVGRGEGDVHPYGNPHYSLDPRRMVKVANLLADHFAIADPEHATLFFENAEKFGADIEAKIEFWRGETAHLREIPIIIHRRNWTYLIDFLGLNVIGEIENRPGIAPSPRHVHELIERGSNLPQLVIMAALWDDEASAEVAERTGASLALLPAQVGGEDGVDNYFQLLDTICKRLAEASTQQEEM